jgi:hypothetical protein
MTTDTPIEEAVPRSAEEWASLKSNPEIVGAASERGVTEIVHFTTVQGAVGILASGSVKSRKRLPEDAYLEHVYKPNALSRSRDLPWLDYVNLSVTQINVWMFGSSKRWHSDEGVSWVILSFRPSILQDPGVVFTTTNNAYPTCLRAEGIRGFERMFAERVIGYSGQIYSRSGIALNRPSDRTAEVLYPGQLGLGELQMIYVQVEETLDDITGACGGLGLTVPTRWAPEAFQ